MTQECKRDAIGDFCTQSLIIDFIALRGYLGPEMQTMTKILLQVFAEEFDPSLGRQEYSVAKVSFYLQYLLKRTLGY